MLSEKEEVKNWFQSHWIACIQVFSNEVSSIQPSLLDYFVLLLMKLYLTMKHFVVLHLSF